MKLNRLEYTKKLYPHWLDRNDQSNFVKHLKVVNHQLYDTYHKLKTVDWARMLEKPIQIWKDQTEPYNYIMNFKVSMPYLKEINIYKNPQINNKGVIGGYSELIYHKDYPTDDTNVFEYSVKETTQVYDRLLVSGKSYDSKWKKSKKGVKTIENEYVTIGGSRIYDEDFDEYYYVGDFFPFDEYITVPDIIEDPSKEGLHIVEFKIDSQILSLITDFSDYNYLTISGITENGTKRGFLQVACEKGDVFRLEISYNGVDVYKNGSFHSRNANGLRKFKLFVHYEASDERKISFDYFKMDKMILEDQRKIIPNDTYIIEVKTWDDYHFVKGFPENDYLFYNELDYKFNESFLKINLEEISYSKYLTFRVHMDKIKYVEILKNEKRIYFEDFILESFDNHKLYSSDFSYKYFDYSSYDSFEDIYEIENADANTKIIYRANIEKDEYVFRLPLSDDDFVKVFDCSELIGDYPNAENHIILEEYSDPSNYDEDSIVIINEDGQYNAYLVVSENNEKSYQILQSNIDYTYGSLKDTYDLFVTVFGKGGKCTKEDIIDFSRVLTNNYTIDGCLDTVYDVDDCIIVNKLPTPSINTLKKLLVIKEGSKYKGYKTEYNDKTGNYFYTLLLEDIEYYSKDIPKADKTYKKRYSGYDDIFGDCFDHDYSLDMIGHLFNIHRYKFKQIPYKNPYYYSRTYPSYNNRSTEDDYHYMKRIQYYIQNYNNIYFPVLEFWKYYYTDSTLVNRKEHIGVQDRSFFRTSYDSTCLDEFGNVLEIEETLIDEEFNDGATISEYENIDLITESTSTNYMDNAVYYNINKATVLKGSSNLIKISGYENVWYESIIVNNVFVVPNTNYRLRYGVSNNEYPVTSRMICFDRKGNKLHSIPISDYSDDLDDRNYPTTQNYSYTDILINIPSDTAYIQVVLESDSQFEFADITFQRETVIGFDNKYMKSYLNWNSCIYDLYVNYDDIPINLTLDDSYKFNLLFKKSLPISKIGFLNLNLNKGGNNYLEISTSSSITITDYFGNYNEVNTGETEYSFMIENFFEEGYEYMVKYYSKSSHSNNAELITSKIKFYDDNFNLVDEYVFEDEFYSELETKVNFTFEVPDGATNGMLKLESDNAFDCWDISLKEYTGE